MIGTLEKGCSLEGALGGSSCTLESHAGSPNGRLMDALRENGMKPDTGLRGAQGAFFIASRGMAQEQDVQAATAPSLAAAVRPGR